MVLFTLASKLTLVDTATHFRSTETDRDMTELPAPVEDTSVPEGPIFAGGTPTAESADRDYAKEKAEEVREALHI